MASQTSISISNPVLTRTPLRVSFAGGGTDLSAFYEREDGLVFSAAIDKYVYVTVKRHADLFDEPIRLNYSQTELVDSVSDIENDIARECLRLLEVGPPLYINVFSDAPAASGLGSSSSFAVGLLNALHAYRGERVSAGQLAEEAATVEIEMLGRPIGKQDQYAAAFGGINVFRFMADGSVTVDPQILRSDTMEELFGHIMMFWTGISRDSSSVLTEQQGNTESKLVELLHMREHAIRLQSMVSNSFEPEGFGRILDETWQIKRQLASTVSNSAIDAWYARAMKAGAYGGKLCGAGGGGFLLLLVPQQRRSAVSDALNELRQFPIGPEAHGSTVLL